MLILIQWCSDLQKPHRLLESLMVIFSQFLTLKFSHIFNVQNSSIYSQHWKVSIVRDTIHARFHIFYFPTDYRNITIFLLNVIHCRRDLFKCVHYLYLRIHATRHYRYCLFDIWAQERSWYTVFSMQLHSTM